MINNNTFERVQPGLDISRSKFPYNSTHKTTFNAGELVPIYFTEVLPGDTFNMKTNILLRLSTLLTPIMDDLFIDTYFFFVPNRLVWSHWKEFMGENTASAWIPSTTYSIPQIESPDSGWSVGTIADHLGVPTGIKLTGDYSISALPFRAMALIYNEWFRDENLLDPASFNVDDSTITGSNGSNYITDIAKGGMCPKVARFHDYFSSALPSPQKAADVTLPLGDNALVYQDASRSSISLSEYTASGSTHRPISALYSYDGTSDFNRITTSGNVGYNSNGYMTVGGSSSGSSDARFAGVYADLSTATATTINELRLAFQMQKLYEKDARCGTRYIEVIKGHFNVDSPDARLQRPEFLGGDRCPINIQQVVQTSSTQAGSTAQGNTSAYSLTFSHDASFMKSFTEHGLIMGFACVRHNHTYQQGLNKMWSKKNRFDYYWPVLANIGEQPIKNKEIYSAGNVSGTKDNETFGYQEAWAEYRYMPSIVSGEFRSTYSTPLDSWHLGDYYSSLPVLSQTWINEGSSELDRCLAVKSTTHNQILADFYFDCDVSRAMPLYSVPGLIDHH